VTHDNPVMIMARNSAIIAGCLPSSEAGSFPVNEPSFWPSLTGVFGVRTQTDGPLIIRHDSVANSDLVKIAVPPSECSIAAKILPGELEAGEYFFELRLDAAGGQQ
jgi:hypothetical protein